MNFILHKMPSREEQLLARDYVQPALRQAAWLLSVSLPLGLTEHGTAHRPLLCLEAVWLITSVKCIKNAVKGLRFYSTCKLRDQNASFTDAGRRQTIPDWVPSFLHKFLNPQGDMKRQMTHVQTVREPSSFLRHTGSEQTCPWLWGSHHLCHHLHLPRFTIHMYFKKVRNKAVRVTHKYAEKVRCTENRLPEPGAKTKAANAGFAPHINRVHGW